MREVQTIPSGSFKKKVIKTIWTHSTTLYYDVFIVRLALWRTLRVSELNHDPDGIFLHFSQNVSILNLWGCSIFFYTSFWVKKTSRVSKLATIWSKNKVHSALNFFFITGNRSQLVPFTFSFQNYYIVE